jgi:hypothetical protein
MKTQFNLHVSGIDKKSNPLFVTSSFAAELNQLTNMFAGADMYQLLDEIIKPFKGNEVLKFTLSFEGANNKLIFEGKKSGGNALAIPRILSSFMAVCRKAERLEIDFNEVASMNAIEKRSFYREITTRPVSLPVVLN